MAIPAVLTNNVAYGAVWNGAVNIGQNVKSPAKGMVAKNFHAYLDLYEQSAHDATISGYVRRLGGNSRPPHRAQVRPANANAAAPLTYYNPHGQVVAQLVANYMQNTWAAAAAANVTVFQQGQARALAVQGQRQPNGFHYDVTMWYDVADVYCSFHCYAP